MLNEFLCFNPIKNMYRYSASHLELGTGKDAVKPSYIWAFIFCGTRKNRWRYKITQKNSDAGVCVQTVQYSTIFSNKVFKHNIFFGNGSECDGH